MFGLPPLHSFTNVDRVIAITRKLTVLYEGEDRVPDKVVRNLIEVDEEASEDDERHQDLPGAVQKGS